MKFLRKTSLLFFLVLMLAVLVLMPGTARAQETITLEVLTVRVWPEFDQPNALVIMEGEFSADAILPAELQVPLPPGVVINAVAYPDPSTLQLLSAEYEQQGDMLILQVPNGIFWLEFYDPGLVIQGDSRSYLLNWTSPFDINELTFWVQTPYNGSSLEVEPSEGGITSNDQFNLPNFVVSEQDVSAGDTISLSFSYTKTDDTLTAAWLDQQAPVEVPAPVAPPAVDPVTTGPPTWMTIGLLVVGLALVGGGVYWFVKQSRPPATKRRAVPRSGTQGAAGRKFCTECGAQVQPDDKFCRSCGARL